MRSPTRSPWLPLLAASLWPATALAAVRFDWVTVGHPGNACETQTQGCFGAVAYTYRISRFEVTDAQYAEFLNAKAASDRLGLYSTDIGSTAFGGITRSGTAGSYTYGTITEREDKPVTYISFFDALPFANWLHNGQDSGDTETGAYTLLGGTPTPSNELVGLDVGATVFLTSEDEWYKAAFYDPGTATYFDYLARRPEPARRGVCLVGSR